MWKRNLHIFGIDLRDLRSVIRLCDRIASSYPKLDMIINNAAQTIRRPAAYYRHLLPNELQPARVPSEARSLVQADPHNANDTKAPLSLDHASTEQFERLPTAFVEEVKGTGNDTQVLRDLVASMGTNSTEVQPMKLSNTHAYTYLYQVLPVSQSPPNLRAPTVVTTPTLFPAPEASTSALMTQHVVHPEDAASEKTKEAFPVGLYDVEGAQIDLRKENSWVLLLHQVDPAELVEVFAVNALAPFIINSRLRELLQRGQGNKFIVNVSAMEGKFYRHKGPQHPHTNMAKAALNMMTRTSACEYAEHKIYMNSIDTGWINDENPFEAAQRIAGTNFQTPIDEEDAMARVLDPVLTDSTVFGKFLKDFNETEW
jgi:NAD(P)-dependent dehydrogenase (short-subunit alcohol dehydrogenase family)